MSEEQSKVSMRDEVSEGLNCRKFYFQQVKVLKGKNLISIG